MHLRVRRRIGGPAWIHRALKGGSPMAPPGVATRVLRRWCCDSRIDAASCTACDLVRDGRRQWPAIGVAGTCHGDFSRLADSLHGRGVAAPRPQPGAPDYGDWLVRPLAASLASAPPISHRRHRCRQHQPLAPPLSPVTPGLLVAATAPPTRPGRRRCGSAAPAQPEPETNGCRPACRQRSSTQPRRRDAMKCSNEFLSIDAQGNKGAAPGALILP